MKKYFNEQTEAIIQAEIKPVDSDPKEGQIQPHRQIVTGVKFYYSDGDRLQQIWLPKNFFYDIVKQIEEIESTQILANYDMDLPF